MYAACMDSFEVSTLELYILFMDGPALPVPYILIIIADADEEPSQDFPSYVSLNLWKLYSKIIYTYLYSFYVVTILLYNIYSKWSSCSTTLLLYMKYNYLHCTNYDNFIFFRQIGLCVVYYFTFCSPHCRHN